MTRRKAVFFGTPELAADILEKLSLGRNFQIVAVVTNPDAPSGRGQKLTPSAVNGKAQELRIPVYTPEKLNDEAYRALESLEADVFLVVAYGKLFPESFIQLPKIGTFNLHFSLLPKYRGASPVQSAILNGEKISGITIFELVKKMDAGDVYVQEEIDIEKKNAAEAFEEMVKMGGNALLEFSEAISAGKKFSPVPQDESEATYCKKFSKSDGQIFPEKETADEIFRKYRAFFLWPQIFYIDPKSGKRIKFLNIQKWSGPSPQANGLFSKIENTCIMRTHDGFLEILEAQPEGKNMMTGIEFFNYFGK